MSGTKTGGMGAAATPQPRQGYTGTMDDWYRRHPPVANAVAKPEPMPTPVPEVAPAPELRAGQQPVTMHKLAKMLGPTPYSDPNSMTQLQALNQLRDFGYPTTPQQLRTTYSAPYNVPGGQGVAQPAMYPAAGTFGPQWTENDIRQLYEAAMWGNIR